MNRDNVSERGDMPTMEQTLASVSKHYKNAYLELNNNRSLTLIVHISLYFLARYLVKRYHFYLNLNMDLQGLEHSAALKVCTLTLLARMVDIPSCLVYFEHMDVGTEQFSLYD